MVKQSEMLLLWLWVWGAGRFRGTMHHTSPDRL
jgi:hypothetical protein